MEHRITMITPTPNFIQDSIPLQFPFIHATEDIRVIIPAQDTIVIEFRFDGHLLTWMHFCVYHGINFTYVLI
jgi:hypothetical protein